MQYLNTIFSNLSSNSCSKSLKNDKNAGKMYQRAKITVWTVVFQQSWAHFLTNWAEFLYAVSFLSHLQILFYQLSSNSKFKGLKPTIIIFFQARQEGPKRGGRGANLVSSSTPQKCTMSTTGFKNIMVKYSLCLGLLWIPRSHITCLYWPH